MESEKAVRLVERGYNKLYRRYSAQRGGKHWRANRTEVEDLMARLEKDAKVMDAGCGNGYITRMLAAKGFAVVGTDLSANMLKLAKKNVPKAKFYRMDMRKLKFPKATFDAVTCFYAIIHVPKQYHLRVLKGFNRVLKPKGLLLISMSLGGLKPREEVEKDWEKWGAPMYWSQYGKQKNLQLVRKAGFKIIWQKTETTGPAWDRHLYILAQKK